MKKWNVFVFWVDTITFLTDLPMLNGLEVLKKIKENPETSTIPAVILSNIGQDQTVKEAMERVRDYILKYRFSPAEVIAKIRSAF